MRISSSLAVEPGLAPGHWPPFADSAWMDVETVRDDPGLLSMVDPLDRHRVVSDDE